MPCVSGLARRVNDTPGSGCRADCLHRADVEAYRETKVLADEVRKIDRERATNGHPAEGAEYDQDHPPFTFRQWLTGRRRREDSKP